MPIPVRDTFDSDRADLKIQVTDDGSRTLVRTGTSDSFHSGCGALSETEHVYIKNSGVLDRLRHRRPTRVLEVGLGTAMGLIATLSHAIDHDCELEYVALETDWVSASIVRMLRPYQWTKHHVLVDRFLAYRDSLSTAVAPGSYPWTFDSKRRVRIEIVDVLRWKPEDTRPFDAIYFDPFCPENAPELWTPDCFKHMRSLIDSGGSLTTYSCSRPVRDALEAGGWNVTRVPGPAGGKREVLVANPGEPSPL
ncbi:tRNA (5-methylaminomethyl-2-thiouridine)(34)-methyltransferase MnmD [Roseiconus lacunae]|uniref:tRNA (5-methylaminomethyl-2-thiouridine)(34)-methyltransferase MnmD n=1 Tax=Roseiconus lacunae TaxID=2605694 RepID=UPI0011F1447E|nr:tRNA (5-methylaminomethyl-2-thiouridine)(34)-methyltransferase MnmD [Roseiconus lacunae]